MNEMINQRRVQSYGVAWAKPKRKIIYKPSSELANKYINFSANREGPVDAPVFGPPPQPLVYGPVPNPAAPIPNPVALVPNPAAPIAPGAAPGSAGGILNRISNFFSREGFKGTAQEESDIIEGLRNLGSSTSPLEEEGVLKVIGHGKPTGLANNNYNPNIFNPKELNREEFSYYQSPEEEESSVMQGPSGLEEEGAGLENVVYNEPYNEAYYEPQASKDFPYSSGEIMSPPLLAPPHEGSSTEESKYREEEEGLEEVPYPSAEEFPTSQEGKSEEAEVEGEVQGEEELESKKELIDEIRKVESIFTKISENKDLIEQGNNIGYRNIKSTIDSYHILDFNNKKEIKRIRDKISKTVNKIKEHIFTGGFSKEVLNNFGRERHEIFRRNYENSTLILEFRDELEKYKVLLGKFLEIRGYKQGRKSRSSNVSMVEKEA